MRFLFTTLPGTSLVLPWVATAQAAQSAGHEVLVGVSGPGLATAADAGLIAVATDDGEARRVYEKVTDRLTEHGGGDEADEEVTRYYGSLYADVSAAMIDGLLRTATAWRPDVVVYTPPAVAGLVTARVLGVPAVMHGIGTPFPTHVETLTGFASEAARRGVTGLVQEIRDVEIDLSPPSLDALGPSRPPAHRRSVMPMRFTAYTGGAQLPDGLLERGPRPRVVATLGTFTRWFSEGRPLVEVIMAAADLDLDLVVVTAGADLPALPSPLPEHVSVVDWVPLRMLLAVSDAVIHHGGPGSMYAAFAAGVPQLVLAVAPGPPSYANARIVAGRGTGVVVDMDQALAATLKPAVEDLVVNEAYRRASREVAAEIAVMPAPATVVDQLTEFVAAYQRYQRPRPPARA